MREGSRSLKKMGLKPCPFCGGKVRFMYDLWGDPTGIWCDDCHSLTTFSRLQAKRGEKFGDVMDRMTKAWNRRTQDRIGLFVHDDAFCAWAERRQDDVR